jgi:drug/metabolite transporter (DMT)-like permease
MYLAIKWALESFPPFYQMGTQFLVAGILLGLLAHRRREPWPDRRQWGGAAILGALLLGGGYGFTALAETRVSSGLVVAFGAIVPTLVALAELPYGRRPGLRQMAGILIGLVGIVLLSEGQGFGSSILGLVSISIACITWVIGSIWAVHGLPGGTALHCAPGFMGHASQMVCGGVLLLLMSWAVGEAPQWPPQPLALASWAFLMVAGSLIGYTAYMILLARTTPTLAASYTYVNPVVALVLGFALDGERVSGQELGAIVAVLLGVVLLMLPGRSRAPAH